MPEYTVKDLPCHKGLCPKNSVCCTGGTTLTRAEYDALAAKHGPQAVRDYVIDPNVKDARMTALVNGTCFFQKDNRCTIHGRPEYPAMCRTFPSRKDGYVGPVSICPYLKDEPGDFIHEH